MADLDLTGFAYRLAGALEREELTLNQAAQLTGIGKAQISKAMRGQRISAGNTVFLAWVFEIDLELLMPETARQRLARIRRYRGSVARETSSETLKQEAAE